jgi:hypothetical protein
MINIINLKILQITYKKYLTNSLIVTNLIVVLVTWMIRYYNKMFKMYLFTVTKNRINNLWMDKLIILINKKKKVQTVKILTIINFYLTSSIQILEYLLIPILIKLMIINIDSFFIILILLIKINFK